MILRQKSAHADCINSSRVQYYGEIEDFASKCENRELEVL